MCRLERADAVIATKRSDAVLNAQDRNHLRRAVINADRALLYLVADTATHPAI